MIASFAERIHKICREIVSLYPKLEENYTLSLECPNVSFKLSEIHLLVEIWKFKPNSDQTLFSNFLGKNAFCYTFPYKSSELLLNEELVSQKFKENFLSKIDWLVENIKKDAFLFEGCSPWEYNFLREFASEIIRLRK